MTPAAHRAALHRATRSGEWEMAERATRALAWRWLLQSLARAWRLAGRGR
ncbi:hypothetical protein [Falsiroseomonas stagni]|uniref:Uncharacterized protein n=1 Tax=Falsiroseomonas stagni DSM 19981 TaxID=1123062 RepID=A0A1I3Y0D2_9PROT|nr:hypothetical protein [Falsiroseomonas stagni]SFK24761.1 hypothetical protein SAMN02745775_101782 [Falsiroseomonas stagni DSM 19981]